MSRSLACACGAAAAGKLRSFRPEVTAALLAPGVAEQARAHGLYAQRFLQ
jgi:hypothetical protein